MSGYTYNVIVSQIAIIQHGYDDIDISDMAIYSEIVNIISFPRTQKLVVSGVQYSWISHQLILDRMPLLRIRSKSSIKRKINKLIERNMIDRLETPGAQKSYYRLTDFHESYKGGTSFKNGPRDPNLNGDVVQNRTGTSSKFERGRHPNLNDNDITNNDITDNDKKEVVVLSSDEELGIQKKEEEKLVPAQKEEETILGKAWNEWIEYKKIQHRFSFKAEKFEMISKKKLWKISNGDQEVALAIIEQSIANGWKGFQPLKNQPTTKTSSEQNGFEALMKFTS